MNKNYEEQIEELIELGKRLTKLELSTAEIVEKDWCECPLCGGEGYVNVEAYINIADKPLNVQFSGIGEEHVDWCKFLEQAVISRAAIEEMYAENKRLHKALERMLLSIT